MRIIGLTVPDEKPKPVCPDCNAEFEAQAALSRHIKEAHAPKE